MNGAREEKKMYPILLTLFNYITPFSEQQYGGEDLWNKNCSEQTEKDYQTLKFQTVRTESVLLAQHNMPNVEKSVHQNQVASFYKPKSLQFLKTIEINFFHKLTTSSKTPSQI